MSGKHSRAERGGPASHGYLRIDEHVEQIQSRHPADRLHQGELDLCCCCCCRSPTFVSSQDLGYKADLGYQTFMYINEHDIRRLLLFLIERIARDDEKNEFEPAEERNGAELSVRRKLRAMDWDNVWVPYDTEQTKNTAYLTHLTRLTPQVSTSPAFHLQAFLSKSLSKKVQVYAKHKLSQQSSNTNELLPTAVADILEWNARNWTKSSQADEEPDLLRLTTHRTHRLVTRTKAKVNKIEEVHRQKLREEIREDQPQEEAGPEVNKEEVYARRISQLEAELAEADEKLRARRGAQTELNNCEADYKNKCKLLEAAFKSRQELLADIETLREQIEQMTESWESLQAQLRDQLKTRHQESVAHNEQVSRKLAELRQLTKSITSGLSEVDAKEALVAELTAKTPAQWPPNRGSYTRRIIEIIANVSRQNAETRKVLLETRKVQRDINTLEGKIRRCLAVADEAIFREARENEWCRSCYLLLAQLQANCNQLVDHVGDIGATRRETRRLEEMVSIGVTTTKTNSYRFSLGRKRKVAFHRLEPIAHQGGRPAN